MEEPEPGEKSIIDDYHCLFSKSGIQLSKKQIHEAFSKPIDEKWFCIYLLDFLWLIYNL